MMVFYILEPTGVVAGPYDAPEMVHLLELGAICRPIRVAAAGDSGWHPLSELLPLILFEARENHEDEPPAESRDEIIRRAREGTSPLLLDLMDDPPPPEAG